MSRKLLSVVVGVALLLSGLIPISPAQAANIPGARIGKTFAPKLLTGIPPKIDRLTLKGLAETDAIDAYFVTFKGPIHSSERKRLESIVEYVDGYLQDFSFLVVARPSQILRLLDVMGDRIAAIYAYPPEMRIHPNVKKYNTGALVASVYNLTSKRREIKVISVKAPITPTEMALNYIKNSENIVLTVMPKAKVVPFNDQAVKIIKVKQVAWETYGYDGAGIIVDVVDTGLDTGTIATLHEDLRDNTIAIIGLNGNPTADYVGHGTHVSGSIIGNGYHSQGRIKGMAPGAKLIFQSAGSDLDGIPPEIGVLFFQGASYGARVHSNSWGVPYPFGYIYDYQAKSVDNYMWNASNQQDSLNDPDSIVLFSAGNFGPNRKTVTTPATAKNVITVGASENYRPDHGYLGDNPNEVAQFSSRGPAPDGRVKPDVVAPGTWVLSTRSSMAGSEGYWELYDQYYAYDGGTSMATPITAGFIAVLKQYLRDKHPEFDTGATIKALLLAGATPLGPEYPSIDYGYGLINMEGVMSEMEAGNYMVVPETASNAIETGQERIYHFYVDNENHDLRVLLVWTDYPGEENAAKSLVNDLDLEVYDPYGNLIVPSTATITDEGLRDNINNVESVRIEHPHVGAYTVKVKGYNVPYGPQRFALVVRADLGKPDNVPPIVKQSFSNGEEVSDIVTITATATDPSGIARMNIYIDDNLILTSTNTTQASWVWNTFNYENGLHTVKIEAYDLYHNLAVRQLTVNVNNTPGNVILKMVYPDGTPVDNASVTIVHHYFLETSYNGTSNTDGILEFDGIQNGYYRATIEKGNFARTATIWVQPSDTREYQVIIYKKILLVDEWRGATGNPNDTIEGVLHKLGLLYDRIYVDYNQELPDNVELDNYGLVIWLKYDKLSSSEQQRIADYLMSGGHLWAIDEDTPIDMSEQSFAATYFGTEAHLVTDRPATVTLAGIDGGPFEGISFDHDAYYVDSVTATGGGRLVQNIITHEPRGVYGAAVAYDNGTWRTLYLTQAYYLPKISRRVAETIIIRGLQYLLTADPEPSLVHSGMEYTYNQNIAVNGTAQHAVILYRNHQEVARVTPDDGGQFSSTIALQDGKNVITARTCINDMILDLCSDFSEPIVVYYIPSAPGNLSGVVTKDGQPVINTKVQIRNDKYNLYYVTTTDNTGHYEFSSIPAVDYRITVYSKNPPGYYSATVTMAPNTTTSLNIQLGETKPWTIAVYTVVDGGSNVQAIIARKMLEEMEYGKQTDMFNIVFLSDDSGTVMDKAYEVVPDNDINHISSKQINIPGISGEISGGDPNTLYTFAKYVIENYPAQHYALIIIGHGCGPVEWNPASAGGIQPSTVAFDNSSNDNLTVRDIGQALATLYQATGQKFEVIDLNSKHQAAVETIYEIKDYTRYVVAPENDDAEFGNFIGAFKELTQNPDVDALSLANILARNFEYDPEALQDPDWYVLDLSKVPTLKDLISVFGSKLVQAKQNGEPVQTWINNAHYVMYGTYKDVYSLAQQAYNNTSDAGLKQAALAVMNAVDGVTDGDGVVVAHYRRYEADYSDAVYKGLLITPSAYYINMNDYYLSLKFAQDSLWDEALRVIRNETLPQFTVVVKDTNGNGIPRATVHIIGPSADFVAKTGDGGIAGPFTVSGGQYTITAYRRGYESATVTINTDTASSVVVTLNRIVTDEPLVFIDLDDYTTLSGVATVTIEAMDDNKIMYVRFYVDDYLYTIYNGGSADVIYNVPLDTTMFGNGPHTLYVVAADNSNNHGTASVTVIFDNPEVPYVSIVSPEDGAIVTGIVHIVATATDNGQIVEMGILIDGTQVATCTATTICTYDWDTGRLPPGGHVIKAYATDNDGYTSWAQVEVTEISGWEKQSWDMESGWNLITIDVTTTLTLSQIFPDATSIFRLEGNTFYYAGHEVPIPGKGYLIKYNTYKHVELWGEKLEPMQCVDVTDGSGWYAVGPTIDGILVKNMYGVTPDGTTIPIQSVFGYEGHSMQYKGPNDALEKGKGYFVKVNDTVDKICWIP